MSLILNASILFAKGTNTHNQLRFIVTRSDVMLYTELMERLEGIYSLENNCKNQQCLQDFITTYADDIYNKYMEYNKSSGDSYEIK